MKKTLIASVALIALTAGSASAADMYVKARPISPAWDWSGFYAGVNVGVGIPDSPTDTTVINPTPVPNVLFTTTTTSNRAGVVGGAQAGYNKVVLPWLLLGAEADIQGADLRGSKQIFYPVGVQGPGSFAAHSTSLNWFGTLRARGGVLVAPETLIYATGGLAYGEVRVNQTAFSLLGGNTTNSSVSEIKAGWTAGGGVETRLWASNWTTKAEYLYVDLGRVTTPGAALGVGGLFQLTTIDSKEHIVRVGVNYKFTNY